MPPVLTRREVGERILAGEILVIRNGLVLQIPSAWMERHPGGKLAILHFVGRDASAETSAYHSPETLRRMDAFVVGRAESNEDGLWEPFIPPIMTGWARRDDCWMRDAQVMPCTETLLIAKSNAEAVDDSACLPSLEPLPSNLCRAVQHEHAKAYHDLHQQLIDNGLYQTAFVAGYGPEVVRYAVLASLSVWTYKKEWFFTSAFFLGAFWHQLTFTAHDLGHNGVTHNWIIDRLLGIVIANFLGGLSIGWWVDNHNIHHLVTNHPSHDPDIQHIPFFAISPFFAKSLWSSYYQRLMGFDSVSRHLIQFQHLLFYFIMSLARFNLYVRSYIFLFIRAKDGPHARGGKWVWLAEVTSLILFWVWYSLVLMGCGSWKKSIGYVLVSHIVTSPLHVQIVLSHFSRSTDDLGPLESFLHRQLRTTTDVICPDYLAFLHGGLHLQVTHHLFPRLPRHNLKRASNLVKQYATDRGLEYAEFGFIEGNAQVRGVLRKVADQVSIMKTVADSFYPLK